MPTATTTTKTNRYAATCERCTNRLAPGHGILKTRARGGRWTVVCGSGRCAHLAADEARMVERLAKSVTPDTGRLLGAVMVELDSRYHPYIDLSFGNVDEIVMHAMDAYHDRRSA